MKENRNPNLFRCQHCGTKKISLCENAQLSEEKAIVICSCGGRFEKKEPLMVMDAKKGGRVYCTKCGVYYRKLNNSRLVCLSCGNCAWFKGPKVWLDNCESKIE